MSRRIEVELTSERDDGTWTWRAAGARQPKGVLDGSLLYEGAQVGDVVRAEADFDIEGITITQVHPPKHARPEPERIEVLGQQREFKPVIANVSAAAARGEDRRRGRTGAGERRGRPPGGERERRGRPDRPDRPERGPRPEGAGRPPRADRPRRERPAPPEPKPKPKRLRPARVHRDAALAALPPEQQAVAEQVLRGGIPAVRSALDEQNAALRAEGKPEVSRDGVLALAEELLPRLRAADWLDRAEAAMADVDEISLRDLRSVVVSADDVARDESTRELANRLREALDMRVEKAQAEWLADITASLEAGRVVRALRLSARPPEPSFRFPADLQGRLTELAGAALAPDIAPDRWAAVLDAVAYSPVRRDVTPAGAPETVSDELLALARKHVGRVPAVAPLFGLEPPPPARQGKGRRGGDRPRPPKKAPEHVGRPPRPPGAPPPPPPGYRQAGEAPAEAAPGEAPTEEAVGAAPMAAPTEAAATTVAPSEPAVGEAAPSEAAASAGAPVEQPAEAAATGAAPTEPHAGVQPTAATPAEPAAGDQGAPLGTSPAPDAASVPPPAGDATTGGPPAVEGEERTAPLGTSPAPDAASVPAPAGETGGEPGAGAAADGAPAGDLTPLEAVEGDEGQVAPAVPESDAVSAEAAAPDTGEGERPEA